MRMRSWSVFLWLCLSIASVMANRGPDIYVGTSVPCHKNCVDLSVVRFAVHNWTDTICVVTVEASVLHVTCIRPEESEPSIFTDSRHKYEEAAITYTFDQRRLVVVAIATLNQGFLMEIGLLTLTSDNHGRDWDWQSSIILRDDSYTIPSPRLLSDPGPHGVDTHKIVHLVVGSKHFITYDGAHSWSAHRTAFTSYVGELVDAFLTNSTELTVVFKHDDAFWITSSTTRGRSFRPARRLSSSYVRQPNEYYRWPNGLSPAHHTTLLDPQRQDEYLGLAVHPLSTAYPKTVGLGGHLMPGLGLERWARDPRTNAVYIVGSDASDRFANKSTQQFVTVSARTCLPEDANPACFDEDDIEAAPLCDAYASPGRASECLRVPIVRDRAVLSVASLSEGAHPDPTETGVSHDQQASVALAIAVNNESVIGVVYAQVSLPYVPDAFIIEVRIAMFGTEGGGGSIRRLFDIPIDTMDANRLRVPSLGGYSGLDGLPLVADGRDFRMIHWHADSDAWVPLRIAPPPYPQ
jgi:hypothetical protein